MNLEDVIDKYEKAYCECGQALIPIVDYWGHHNGYENICCNDNLIATNLNKDNNLQNINPGLAKEWHPYLNGDLRPEDISPGSIRKIWWRTYETDCDCGWINWRSTLSDRHKNNLKYRSTCYCRSLAKMFPDLLKEWDYDKNEIDPKFVSFSSSKKYWWKCISHKSCSSHVWYARVGSRTSGQNCPWCCSQKICQCNSLFYNHPEVIKLWDYEKNGDIDPKNIACQSDRKFNWKCFNHKTCDTHKWFCAVKLVVNARGCPFCFKRDVVCACDSFLKTFPHLEKEWDYDKNKENPLFISYASSRKKYWWKCTSHKSCSIHVWEASVASRTKKAQTGCPYCCGGGVRARVCKCNSLTIKYPELLKEWNYEENKHLNPDNISRGSNLKVSWICSNNKEHKWISSVEKRCMGRGCPFCVLKTEAKLYDTLFLFYPNLIRQFKADWCRSLETDKFYPFDFLIPNINIIIELDGPQHFIQISNWQSPEITQERDIYKADVAIKNGYSVIRLLQEDVYNDTFDWLGCLLDTIKMIENIDTLGTYKLYKD